MTDEAHERSDAIDRSDDSADAVLSTSDWQGVLRIFLRVGEHAPARTFWERVFGRPAYQAILSAARDFGIPRGFVRHCVAGFEDENHVHHFHMEASNHALPVYVELHGDRDTLLAFCQHAKPLLDGRRTMLYEAESWAWKSEQAAMDSQVKRHRVSSGR